MTRINSVLGLIDTAKLGFTLMHEHTVTAVALPHLTENYPELLYKDDFMESIVVPGLIEAKKGGINTIVDCTTVDLGRDVKLMVEASRRSGVNIIACTGWWLEIPRSFASVSADQFAEIWIRDIRKGMADTDVKAGILKGSSDFMGVTPIEENILRGVARAHIQTGVPISLHSYPTGQVGVRQLEILKEEGIEDLSRVKVDHSNDTTDVEYLVWLLKQGCWLSMDRYPGNLVSSETRTKTLKALIDAGYTDRLLISHDRVPVMIESTVSFEERRRRNPYGFLYIQKIVFPQLRKMGVSDNVLKSLVVDNPRHFFEGISE
jgi:phosphotriesterase-related protein